MVSSGMDFGLWFAQARTGMARYGQRYEARLGKHRLGRVRFGL